MRDRNQDGSFLGCGWSFPPEFMPRRGVVMSEEERDIRESLELLLQTSPGERPFHPSYGLDLRPLVFEPLTTTELTLLKDRIRVAVLLYEPRVELLDLKIDESRRLEGVVSVAIEYRIRATNSRFNLVFPFYSADGSELSSPLELR
ncbi:MAG: GPW/gp25 family protein [Alphaproteobacteria bacterium]|nr:GPW/gp25 family protein [Alphaproteobacteria bacterium]MCB9795344.1 GPW/gp25 family protein [Alphaproteobacteria bacterium]